jgi:hypothetical protein
MIIGDGILGFKRSIDMKEHPNERQVYDFLVEQMPGPGRYIINPEILPEQRFPGSDPIFSIQYSGLGHDDSGQEMLVGLFVMFLAPTTGAWLLRNASKNILSRYSMRVLFLAMIGIVLALFSILARFSLAAYSLGESLVLAVHDFAGWIFAGLAVAWIIKLAEE